MALRCGVCSQVRHGAEGGQRGSIAQRPLRVGISLAQEVQDRVFAHVDVRVYVRLDHGFEQGGVSLHEHSILHYASVV